MKYDLFLFDLDDTLLDFRASEKLSFYLCMQDLGIKTNLDDIFRDYQSINRELWKALEEAKTTQEILKIERFRKTFHLHQIDIDPSVASLRYLDTLPETVVLVDHALETLEWLSQQGEIGIITNGLEYVQSKRINKSSIAPYISFISISETCGYAKPDVRFFEYSSRMAKKFSKERTIIVGDRLEADIQGAKNFGIDSCWYNPNKTARISPVEPTFEISHLSEIKKILKV